jgi:hypothetical protein
MSPTDSALSRTRLPADSARLRTISDSAFLPHPLDGEAAVDVYRPLREIEVAFNGRDQVDLRQPGKPVSQGLRTLRPEIGGLVTVLSARLVAELYCPNAE